MMVIYVFSFLAGIATGIAIGVTTLSIYSINHAKKMREEKLNG